MDDIDEKFYYDKYGFYCARSSHMWNSAKFVALSQRRGFKMALHYVTKQIPNTEFCNICGTKTQWKYAYINVHHPTDEMHTLGPHVLTESDDNIRLVKFCTKCHPKSHDLEINRSIHFYQCYRHGICTCDQYYCSVPNCTRFRRNKNQHYLWPENNAPLAKCYYHQTYCLSCQKITKWKSFNLGVTYHCFDCKILETCSP